MGSIIQMEAQFSRDSASRSWQAGAPRFILAVSSTPGHIVVRALKEVVIPKAIPAYHVLS